MLRQFGVPRPLAPMRPMLGVSNADAPLIRMKPATNSRDIGLAYLQAASMNQPYYNTAFDIMRQAAGISKERPFWPSTSSEQDSQSDQGARRHRKREKGYHRRRTVSAPAIKQHRASRTARRKYSSPSTPASTASGTPDGSASTETSRDGERRLRGRQNKVKGRKKRYSEKRRYRSQPSSPGKQDKHRRRQSVVYSPLFPSQPQPLQVPPTGILYFRDIPPNIPIAQFPVQPLLEAPRLPLGGHQLPQRDQIPRISIAPHKLPQPTLKASTFPSYRTHPVPQASLPLSHAQVASKACPYIREQVELQDEVVAHPPPSPSPGEMPSDLPRSSQASKPLPPKMPTPKMSAAGESSQPAGIQIGQTPEHDVTEQDLNDPALAFNAERAAIAKSSRIVQLWRNKLAEVEQEIPAETTWQFENRAWHTGILSARHEARLGHLRLTYKHRGDNEVTSFKLDRKFTKATLGVSEDIKAVRAACKQGGMLAGVIQKGLPALFRFEWVQAGDRAERMVTDLLILGRIKRDRPYITRHRYRTKSFMLVDGGIDLDAKASEAEHASRRWQWPLQEAPDFSRWFSQAERLEVAFRPSHPDSEIYVISDCNC